MPNATHPPGFHLAQVNTARIRGRDLQDPVMEGFTSQLDAINALARSSAGFVWQWDEAGPEAIPEPWMDPRVVTNLSVWETLEALQAFTYAGAHAGMVRRRREWFEPAMEAHMALWWIPAGHTPGPEEAWMRLAHLQAHGPSQTAFTFKNPFPSPAGSIRANPNI